MPATLERPSVLEAKPIPYDPTAHIVGHEVAGLLQAWYTQNLSEHDAKPHMQRCRAIVYDGTQFSNIPLITYVTWRDMWVLMGVLERVVAEKQYRCIPGWYDYTLRVFVGRFNKAQAGLDRLGDQLPYYQPKLRINGKYLTDEDLALLPVVTDEDIRDAVELLIAGLNRRGCLR